MLIQYDLLVAFKRFHQKLSCFFKDRLIELEKVRPSLCYFGVKQIVEVVLCEMLV